MSLALLGLIFLGYGLIVLLSGSGNSLGVSSDQQVPFDVSTSSAISASSQVDFNNVVMDVEGSVVKPGVYSLKQNARLQDGLIAAGGLSQVADRVWVAKNLNLAMKLSDGAKIYIPALGESMVRLGAAAGMAGGDSTASVNINSASAQDLDALSGIGSATAQKIIDNRPYNSIDDLVSKRAVSQKVFDKIKDQISVF